MGLLSVGDPLEAPVSGAVVVDGALLDTDRVVKALTRLVVEVEGGEEENAGPARVSVVVMVGSMPSLKFMVPPAVMGSFPSSVSLVPSLKTVKAAGRLNLLASSGGQVQGSLRAGVVGAPCSEQASQTQVSTSWGQRIRPAHGWSGCSGGMG